MLYPSAETWALIDTWVERAGRRGSRFGLGDLLIGALASENAAKRTTPTCVAWTTTGGATENETCGQPSRPSSARSAWIRSSLLRMRWLSRMHARLWWFHYDRTPERVALAKAAVDRAVALEPDSPEVHVALGYYYYRCHLDYERALTEFRLALKARENDGDVLRKQWGTCSGGRASCRRP